MPSVLRARGTPAPVSRAGADGRPPIFQDIEQVPVGGVSFSYEGALSAVVEAQEQAERILQGACGEAERLQAEAKKKADKARADARAKGYAEGQARAAQEARAAAADEVAAAAAQMRADVEAFCEAVLEEQARAWRAAEEQLRDLALDIAARVIKAQVTLDPDVVVQITQHAMRRLADKDHVRIRVNPDDVERLRGRRDELMALFEGLRSVEILEDRRVGIGGVQIETETGTLDARIETQMGEIARALS